MSDADTFKRIPLEIFSKGREDLIDEIFAEDYIEHAQVPPGVEPTRDGLRTFVSGLHKAFPDLRYEVIHQFQQDDMHIGHIMVEGTMKGDFAGMPASGKKARWEEIHIGRFKNGKLSEHWGVEDRLGMLHQLGFVQAPSV